MRRSNQVSLNSLVNPFPGNFSCLLLLFLFTCVFTQSVFCEQFDWISFEDEEPSPLFGFTAENRGGNYGMTADIDRDATSTLFGQYSGYLSESWDRVNLPTGISEGLVQVWFYDDKYGTGDPGSQTMANALRLRSEADDPARSAGWPLYYLTIDLKGEYTGHGRSGFMPYYTAAKNDDPNEGMGVTFGYPVGSVNDEIYRATETWHLVSFDIDNGTTTMAIDGEMTDIVETHELSSLELLCRSGWYQTRPGQAKIMRWDGISISPKLFTTDFSTTPSWMTFTEGSSLVFAATHQSSEVPFEFIPGSKQLARFPTGNQSMQCPWNVSRGAIEVWYWDNISDEGGQPDNGGIDIIVSSKNDSSQYIRMRTYESVMGSMTNKWYLVTPQSSAAMGSSLNLSRKLGWNHLVFHKTPACLHVSLNGELVTQEAYRWDTPPDDLVLQITSRSGYNDGFPLWLGRISMAGTLDDQPSSVTNWSLY